MDIILASSAYIVCIIFAGRFVLHALSWITAANEQSAAAFSKSFSLPVIAVMLMDIVLLRRLFRTSKILWLASWTFHASLFFVLLRHVRYFVYPVPDVIVSMQTAGVIAGYILPLSLLLMLILRMTCNKDRYLSFYNFFLLTALLFTAATGILIKLFYRADLAEIKAFMLGIVAFNPGTLPDSGLFIVHFVLALILLPFLPFHLITAPVTTAEARRREEGLNMVIHEK